MRTLALTLLLCAACGDTTLFDMMERQPKYKAYSNNPFYADGRAMRQPPAGTVPRERIIGQPEVTTGKTVAGEDVRDVPLKLDRTMMDMGRKKFEIYCAVCHCLTGDGTSLVSQKMSLRPAPSLHTIKNPSPGHIFQVISQGFGVMPTYASVLEVKERWAVVAYIQALQRSQVATLAEAPPEIQKELQK